MTDHAITLIAAKDLADNRLDLIVNPLTSASRILADHPSHHLIETIRTQASTLANDIDLLTETEGA